MSRQEFLDKLRAALNNSLAPALVADHVRYYEEYILAEVNKGRNEQEVLASLGNPRLIARTIIETNVSGEDGSYDSSSYDSNSYGYGGFQQTRTRENGEVSRQYRVPGWLWVVLVILLVVAIIGTVMSVLSFLAPIFVPIVLVVFLVKLFRDWLN